jgi:methylated-DNA-[protein]-cysteine S-methyltransferase
MTTMQTLYTDRIDTPLGSLVIVTHEQQLCVVGFGDSPEHETKLRQRFGPLRLVPTPNPHGFSDLFRAYFAGEVTALDRIPVNPGGTPFQQQVWLALRGIPAGSTLAYGELAARLGNRAASRAVGHANSQNPVAIVLPCHRVIGANATLTGYAGGLDRKRWLLRHEGALREAQQLAFDM